MRRDIEFRSEGTLCRGWLYTPDRGGRPWPTVVMAHGFSAVKEMRLDRFAEAFAEAGLASVVFDYRSTGASEGDGRGDLDPAAQILDYRNAISFARTRPELDRERVGIWGSSYSGAHVLVVAARDRRVKAVVAQVPLVDGWESMGRIAGEEGRAQLVEQLVAERERIFAGGVPATIPVVDDRGELCALGAPDAWEWFQLAGGEAPNWKNEVTLRSLERLLDYAPGATIERISPTPLLLIAAEQDFLPIDIAERAFARAGEPKRFVRLAAGHFSAYEPPHFPTAAAEAVAWFRQHL